MWTHFTTEKKGIFCRHYNSFIFSKEHSLTKEKLCIMLLSKQNDICLVFFFYTANELTKRNKWKRKLS